MAVVNLYSMVAEHLDILNTTGKHWRLLWYENKFEYRLKCGKKTVYRAPWIGKISVWTSREIEKRKLQ